MTTALIIDVRLIWDEMIRYEQDWATNISSDQFAHIRQTHTK